MPLHPIGPLGAKVLIVGDLPTEQDFLKGEPFIGGGGYELNKILNEAGTFREHVGMTLVLQDRVKGNSIETVIATKKKDITASHTLYRGKYVQQCVIDGVEALERHIRKIKPNVVIPVGNLALWALTGEWGVNSWRSSVMESTLVPGVKVIPTLPPSRIMVQWSTRPLVVHDFKRAVRESAFAEVKRADYNHVIRPNYETAFAVLNLILEEARGRTSEQSAQETSSAVHRDYGNLLALDRRSAWGKVWVGQFQGEGNAGASESLGNLEEPSTEGYSSSSSLHQSSVREPGSLENIDSTGKYAGQESIDATELVHSGGSVKVNLGREAEGQILFRNKLPNRLQLQYLRDSLQKNAPGKKLELGGDIETRAGHIACIAFAWSPTEAICIPLMCQHDPAGYWTLEEETMLVGLMVEIMRVSTIIGQNWNYDAQYIYRYWHFLCPSVIDTMIQQHSCFSNLDKNLAFLSSMYCDDHLYWKDDRTNWTEGPKGEGEDKYWIYNCTDAVRTLAIKRVLDKVVPALGLDEVNAFQQSLAPTVLKTMNKGLRIDYAQRLRFKTELQEGIQQREAWMLDMLGQEVNIKSPKQMQELFYGTFGLKPIINRKTGTPTTDDEALLKISQREPILAPLSRKIRELRSLGVFHSTFIEARPDTDGRMRTSFNICGTDTYRFASRQNAFGTGLNLQNIPSGGEMEDDGLELPNVRTIFVPDEGMEFFDIDLDSADLRIVTWESDCKWMKEQFAAGRKPYIEVMKEYYQNPAMTKNSHPREYAMFKALCHGTNYLGTASGISPRIGLDTSKVEKIQAWYFGLCPEIKRWQDDIKKQVTGRRYIQNVFGYKFHFFDRIEGTVFNQAVAWIPQSSVGCLINRAYKNIDERLSKVDVLIQVHDSLAGQFPIEDREDHVSSIIQQSQITLPYDDPLIIPVGVKTSQRSWGDCS